jgi:hypothetical protein
VSRESLEDDWSSSEDCFSITEWKSVCGAVESSDEGSLDERTRPRFSVEISGGVAAQLVPGMLKDAAIRTDGVIEGAISAGDVPFK